MYKLTVISGPHAGSHFALKPGDNLVGRKSGVDLPLSSSSVSKEHCRVTVLGDDVVIKDLQSSNGTFLNGKLINESFLKLGDRVSIGKYILELRLVSVRTESSVPAVSILDSKDYVSPSSNFPGGMPHGVEPQDFLGKIQFLFERFVMPPFYGWLFKYDWKIIFTGMIVALAFLSIILTTIPVVSLMKSQLEAQLGSRASFLARHIIDLNAENFVQGNLGKATLGLVKNNAQVSAAYLLDLENRIIAPSTYANEYLGRGEIALFSKKVAEAYQSGLETGVTKKLAGGLIASAEPLKIFSSSDGKNVVVAMAVVAFDSSLVMPGMGTIAFGISTAVILVILLALLVAIVLYRLTLKPIEVLNQNIDQFLQGDRVGISREFKFEDLRLLLDRVTEVLERVPSGGSKISNEFQPRNPNDFISPIQMIFDDQEHGVAICDSRRHLVYMNDTFEDVTGIRLESAQGSSLSENARDQAFGSLIDDLFAQIDLGNQSVTESYEFSGTDFSVGITAFGDGVHVDAFLIILKKTSGRYD